MKKILLILSVFICFSLSAQDSSSVYVGDDGSILTDENGFILIPDKPTVTWNPKMVSGIKLWLLADSGKTLDGSNYLSKWFDYSGLNNHVYQSTAANQPLYVANILNGKPVVRFDGINDNLMGNFNSNLSNPLTFFIVWTSKWGSYGYSVAFDDVNATNRMFFYCGAIVNNDGLTIYTNTYFSYTPKTPSFTALHTGIVNGASSSIRENGTEIKTGTTGTVSMQGITIGSLESNTSFLNGDIAEIIMYDNVVSAGDIALIESYMKTKYDYTKFWPQFAQSVPTMVSYTSPSGVVFYSSEHSASYPAWKVFDGVTTGDGYYSNNLQTYPQYIGYQFTTSKKITRYSIISSSNSGNYAPKDWDFQGSNDGSSWTTLSSESNQTGWGGNKRYYYTTNNTAYTYYRLYVTAGNRTFYHITEMELSE